MKMSKAEIQTQALNNATENQSVANYPAIFEGFTAKGIAAEEIKPRENVFTYNAWQALGRQVRRGEKGVKVITWVKGKKENQDGTEEAFRFSRATTVFHISQTDPVNAKPETEQAQAEAVKPEPVKTEKPAESKANDAYDIGEILYTSWGYEQTNVNFYQVIGKKGKATLVVREIAAEAEYSQAMAGKKTPVPGAFLEDAEEIRARIGKGGGLKIEGEYTSRAGFEIINGKTVYSGQYFSTYY